MTSREAKVPAAVLCLATALLLGGCDGESTTTAVPANTVESPAEDVTSAATEVVNDAKTAVNDAAEAVESRIDEVKSELASAASEPVPHDHDGDGVPDHGPGAHDNASASGFANPQREMTREEKLELLNQQREAAQAAADGTADAGEMVVLVSPDEVQLGQIATGDTGVGSLKLTNTGDTPMTVTKIKTSCGCTTSNFKPGTTLQPGEAVDVEVKMKAGTIARTLRKTLTVIVEGQADVVVPVVGEAVAFIEVAPRTLNPDEGETGTLTLTSIDDHAFKITSMAPPVIDEFSDEAKTEHVLNIDWAVWNEVTAGRPNRKLTFYTDHPMAGQVYATVQVKRNLTPNQDTDRTASRPQRTPTVLLSSLLKAGKPAELMKKIEEENIDIETTDASGSTLLGQAAKFGNLAVVNALIEAGANIDAVDRQGGSPLMSAAQSKNPEVVRALLDAGASLDSRDNIGRTALSCAAGLGDAGSVQVLLDAGAEVEVVGAFTGFTPLIWAAGFGDPNSIAPLVEYGANLEAADFIEGATPLIHASRTGKREAMKALIDAGAKLEMTDRNGKTAFIAAAGASNGDVAKLQALLAAGARLDAKDNRGLNALDWAKKRTDGNADGVIRYLEDLMKKEGIIE